MARKSSHIQHKQMLLIRRSRRPWPFAVLREGGPWFSYPLIVSRDSIILLNLAHLQSIGVQPSLADATRYFYILHIFLSPKVFVYWNVWLIRFGWLLILGLYKPDFNKFSNMCHFDYTTVVASKIGPINRLTTPIKWMLYAAILSERPNPVKQLSCNRTVFRTMHVIFVRLLMQQCPLVVCSRYSFLFRRSFSNLISRWIVKLFACLCLLLHNCNGEWEDMVP